MQLTKIKISGFKSFVDPTTIALPSKLVAIVGPNGCGKSNVIDAVTWVMGESSPKYLRGESLTDVIFNGSSARKPIGQASVELIFDNTDGTIGGEYAKYAEISVKRQINRESDSTYFLNGVRCRKRDVVDIFLGTGLGPRSYSIIGQNMISRIIEAKPDDLRTYLEEAAGISKYKERRHETEIRIRHTKENVARVNDVRVELEKQLGHLKHQASVAEKFKMLKAQERVLRAELYGIQWRQLDSQMVDYTLQIQQEETALEGRQAEMTGTDNDVERLRQEQRVTQDAFQEVQKRYYGVGNEITRVEQDILHHQERQQQWENDLRQADQDWQSVKRQTEEAEDQQTELAEEIQTLEPQLAMATQGAEAMRDALQEAEEAMQLGQQQWDEFNQTSAKSAQTAQVEKTRIQHLEQQIASLQKREMQLQQDQGRFDFSALNNELEEFAQQAVEIEATLGEQKDALQNTRDDIHTMQSKQQESNKQLDSVRSELQRLRGQQASLEALQQTALGQRNNPVTPWVEKHDLQSKSRLAQHIEVENGWETAVEKVLGFCLQAICVDKFEEVTAHLDDLKGGNLCVFAANESDKAVSSNKGTLLSDKIQSAFALHGLVEGIYVADTLDDALHLCESLSANESVVTRDGVWLNRSWLKILRQEDAAAGIFQREQELKKLATQIEEIEAKKQQLEQSIEERREQLLALEQQRDQLQQTCSQQQAQLAQVSTQQRMQTQRLSELKAQSERLAKELEDCINQLAKAQEDLTATRSTWEEAMSELEEQAIQRETLVVKREKARQQLTAVRDQANRTREETHALEIRLQTAKSQIGSLRQSMTRLAQQMENLSERKATLEKELAAMPPMDSLQKTLTETLDKHVTVEAELNMARMATESLEQESRNVEETRQIIDREIGKIRNRLEKLRVESQGWKVKTETILEQLKETEYTLEDILKQLEPNSTADEWQSKLDQTIQRVSRLGAINLMAIEEYATCLERKEYLDQQLADLEGGLATLEEAIAKIDKETKAKFKDTFDKVSARFQELFPTVFGGGKAYLELNSEDLLTAGVTMMACPPGKRNSSVHLLSGGEKSLTAIAFIFSIFHLNPAPFCLLDEVDAALDDANVLRFTRLVKVMAEKTQFLFISHNKITIEMGQHLVGVTMNEPGVSRLVSVDMEKAISLATA